MHTPDKLTFCTIIHQTYLPFVQSYTRHIYLLSNQTTPDIFTFHPVMIRHEIILLPCIQYGTNTDLPKSFQMSARQINLLSNLTASTLTFNMPDSLIIILLLV